MITFILDFLKTRTHPSKSKPVAGTLYSYGQVSRLHLTLRGKCFMNGLSLRFVRIHSRKHAFEGGESTSRIKANNQPIEVTNSRTANSKHKTKTERLRLLRDCRAFPLAPSNRPNLSLIDYPYFDSFARNQQKDGNNMTICITIVRRRNDSVLCSTSFRRTGSSCFCPPISCCRKGSSCLCPPIRICRSGSSNLCPSIRFSRGSVKSVENIFRQIRLRVLEAPSNPLKPYSAKSAYGYSRLRQIR